MTSRLEKLRLSLSRRLEEEQADLGPDLTVCRVPLLPDRDKAGRGVPARVKMVPNTQGELAASRNWNDLVPSPPPRLALLFRNTHFTTPNIPGAEHPKDILPDIHYIHKLQQQQQPCQLFPHFQGQGDCPRSSQ